jgi:DNA polymerase elongation subunit (family B)
MEASTPPLYGLDIETDTRCDGLDPRVAAITAVAVDAPDGGVVVTGSEEAVLAQVDAHLAALPPGVLVTWNGAAFDLPFIADRARRAGVRLALRLALDPTIPLRRGPLPGHEGAYRAAWHGHRHLDAYRVYRGDVRHALGVSCSLKSIARLVGLRPVEVDRERIHELSLSQLYAYVRSDAALARALAERRWPTARRFVDVLVPAAAGAAASPGVLRALATEQAVQVDRPA